MDGRLQVVARTAVQNAATELLCERLGVAYLPHRERNKINRYAQRLVDYPRGKGGPDVPRSSHSLQLPVDVEHAIIIAVGQAVTATSSRCGEPSRPTAPAEPYSLVESPLQA